MTTSWKIQRLARALVRGAVIAYPTDTIWGLGCNPYREDAVNRLLSLKRRSRHKGLILLSASIDYCRPFIDPHVFNQYHSLLSTPGKWPRTWIVEASTDCPAWLTGMHSSVAVRITDKPLIRHLTGLNRTPLISTSANRSGHRNARNGLQVRRYFGRAVDFIIDDAEQPSPLNTTARASEIFDLRSGKTLRA